MAAQTHVSCTLDTRYHVPGPRHSHTAARDTAVSLSVGTGAAAGGSVCDGAADTPDCPDTADISPAVLQVIV